MATFIRNLARAGPSRHPLFARSITTPSAPPFQPTSANPLTSSTTPNSRLPYPRKEYGMESAKPNPPLSDFRSAPENIEVKSAPGEELPFDESDKWWANQSARSREVLPGNQWTGRSKKVWQFDTMAAFKQLSGLLSRSGVKKYVRRGEFYEKPSERKRRLGTERHRRRFQEMVREKVQTVQMIRNRG